MKGAKVTIHPLITNWRRKSKILSVLFAYWTNRSFVFKSHTTGQEMLKEFWAFVSGRIATGVLDFAIMYIMIANNSNDNLAKLISNIIVIIANYVFSKLWIFKKDKK